MGLVMCRGPWIPMLVSVAGVACAAGCHRPSNPWKYAQPPAVAVSNVYARPLHTNRTVIAVANFANPDAPQLDWPDVGREMTGAMRRALFNESDFEVRIAPEIEALVSDPKFLRDQAKTKVEPVEVDYVITGKVTDFHHTSGLHEDVRRWGLFARRHEAVVAIEWKVVDVRRRRVVAADHTYGTAEASRKKSIEKIYAGLDASAYLFWNTPLGRAGHQAVDNTIRRLRELLPTHIGMPTIVGVAGDRKVAVNGGSGLGLVEGQEYFVSVWEQGAAEPRPVLDVDTGRPLLARIGRVKRDTSTAWLMGKHAEDVDLRGAVLSAQPPLAPQDVAGRESLADLTGDDG